MHGHQRNVYVGLSISLAALVLASTALWTVDTIAKGRAVIATAQDTPLRLAISTPADGDTVATWMVALGGIVAIADSVTGNDRTDVKTLLADRRIDIVPFVRPLIDQTQWWAQERPLIHPDGTIEGSLSLGDQQGLGSGLSFQVVLMAVPADTALLGERFAHLPTCFAMSSTITIARTL